MCSGGRGGPQQACSALPVSAVAGPRFARFTEPRSGPGSSATVANWASRRLANLSFGAPEPATHQRLLTAVENGDAGRSRANGRSRTSFIGNWMSRSAKIIAASGQATPMPTSAHFAGRRSPCSRSKRPRSSESRASDSQQVGTSPTSSKSFEARDVWCNRPGLGQGLCTVDDVYFLSLPVGGTLGSKSLSVTGGLGLRTTSPSNRSTSIDSVGFVNACVTIAPGSGLFNFQ